MLSHTPVQCDREETTRLQMGLRRRRRRRIGRPKERSENVRPRTGRARPELVRLDQLGSPLQSKLVVGKLINLYEAKTHLSALVDRAAEGEEIIIAKAGRPMARLVPLAQRAMPREPGGWEGQVRLSEDFDAPLPEEIAAAFGADKPE